MWDYQDSDLDQEYWSRMNAIASRVIRVDDVDQLKSELPDAEVLLVQLGNEVNRELIDIAGNLKYVAVFGQSRRPCQNQRQHIPDNRKDIPQVCPAYLFLEQHPNQFINLVSDVFEFLA